MQDCLASYEISSESDHDFELGHFQTQRFKAEVEKHFADLQSAQPSGLPPVADDYHLEHRGYVVRLTPHSFTPQQIPLLHEAFRRAIDTVLT